MLDPFNVYSNHAPLNYNGKESKSNFAVYGSDIPVTLKYNQGHQTWYELLDPERGHNRMKFERLPLSSVCQKANVKSFRQIKKH